MSKAIIHISFLFICFFLLFGQLNSQQSRIGDPITYPANFVVTGAVSTTSAIFGGESTGISIQRNWPAIGFNQYYNAGTRYINNGYGAAMFLYPDGGGMYLDLYPYGIANNVSMSTHRALSILANGNVGIQNSFPEATLSVGRGNPAEAWSGTAMFMGSTYHSHFNYGNEEYTFIRAGMNGSEVMLNDYPGLGKVSLGNGSTMVGINNPDPVLTLEIRGAQNGLSSSYCTMQLESTNRNNWWGLIPNYSDGRLELYYKRTFQSIYRGYFSDVNGNYYATSDRRLKSNVQDLPPVLDKVMQLNPVLYQPKYNNPEKEWVYGFIAQEVKSIFPQLVRELKGIKTGYPDVNDMYVMNYSGFGVVAIQAVKEQQAQLNALQSTADELNRRLDKLEKKD